VLDSNYSHISNKHYSDSKFYDEITLFVNPDQLAWLSNDLAANNSPVIILIHGDLSDTIPESNGYYRVNNRLAIRTILENSGKVLAVFSGHCHNFANNEGEYNYSIINDIPYFCFRALSGTTRWVEITIDFDNLNMQVKDIIHRGPGSVKNVDISEMY